MILRADEETRSKVRVSRREFLAVAAAAIAGMAPLSLAQPPSRPAAVQRYRIAASDWMLLKRQKLGALKLAKSCGLDGIELDMGSLGDRAELKNALTQPEFRDQYLAEVARNGLSICSLALSAFYGHDWTDYPQRDSLSGQWVELMEAMRIEIGFLPLGPAHLEGADPATWKRTVDSLRILGALAKKANIIIGVESSLGTGDYRRLLDDVASPAVLIDYNVGDQMKRGEDIFAQLRDLGKDAVCQIHCTQADGAWLDSGPLDVPRLKRVLDDIGWSGWLVLQRSRVPGKSVEENFSANAAYLKRIFQSG